MDFPIPIPSFENRNLLLRVGILGAAKIIVDGARVYRAKGVYVLRDNAGREVVLKLKNRIWDPIPIVELSLQRIHVAPLLLWYEYVWISIPLILVFAGGAIGGLLGALAVRLSIQFFRTRNSKLTGYLVSGGCSLAAVILYLVITLNLLVLVRRSHNISKNSSIEEVHGSTHNATFTQAGTKIDVFGYPLAQLDRIHLRSLLVSKRFMELDTVLDGYQKKFEQDFHWEDYPAIAFGAFMAPDESLEPFFDAWAASSVHSYQPLLAHAMFEMGFGWRSRGTKWAAETDAGNFAQMESHFARAGKDAKAAIAIRSGALVAYEILLNIVRSHTERDSADDILDKALNVCPYSYRVRERYMMNLLPRWGGSYGQMSSFADEADEFAHIAPKLRLLHGFEPWDKGRVAASAEQLDRAEEAYTEALTFGECWQFHEDRGIILRKLNRYDEALNEFDRALSCDPQNISVMMHKARALSLAGRTTEASSAVEFVRSVDPSNDQLSGWNAWASQSLVINAYHLAEQKRNQEAIALYNQAIAASGTNAQAFLYRARCYQQMGMDAEAIRDVKQAMTLDPHYLEAYLAFDNLLIRRKEYDAIIAAWTHLIDLEPGNARAFCERGGTFYHKGDRAAAQADAQKACDLGYEQACQLAKALAEN